MHQMYFLTVLLCANFASCLPSHVDQVNPFCLPPKLQRTSRLASRGSSFSWPSCLSDLGGGCCSLQVASPDLQVAVSKPSVVNRNHPKPKPSLQPPILPGVLPRQRPPNILWRSFRAHYQEARTRTPSPRAPRARPELAPDFSNKGNEHSKVVKVKSLTGGKKNDDRRLSFSEETIFVETKKPLVRAPRCVRKTTVLNTVVEPQKPVSDETTVLNTVVEPQIPVSDRNLTSESSGLSSENEII